MNVLRIRAPAISRGRASLKEKDNINHVVKLPCTLLLLFLHFFNRKIPKLALLAALLPGRWGGCIHCSIAHQKHRLGGDLRCTRLVHFIKTSSFLAPMYTISISVLIYVSDVWAINLWNFLLGWHFASSPLWFGPISGQMGEHWVVRCISCCFIKTQTYHAKWSKN